MVYFARIALLCSLRRVGLSSIALTLLLASSLCGPRAASQTSSGVSSKQLPQSQLQPDDGEDAEIFVRPLSSAGANIGVAYSRRVSHSIVNGDVKRLLTAGPWQLASSLQISDTSVHPDRPKEFPPTTGVFFRVSHAPQVTANAPCLLPYLKAFQRLRRFGLSFEMPALQPYSGVTNVTNSVTDIQMLRDEGLYTFQISIHNHKENIPALVNSGEAIDRTHVGSFETAASWNTGSANVSSLQVGGKLDVRPPNYLLIVALALGAGTLVGGSLYVIVSRKESR